MELIIFTGNIGSGKSTLASKYAKRGYVVVNMDAITTMVQGGEYGLYDKLKKPVYHTTEDACIRAALGAGLSVVVDRTNMKASDRKRYIDIGKQYGVEIKSVCWGSGSINTTQRRVDSSNGIPAEQWFEVAEFMARSYEPPALSEGFDAIIPAPERYYFYAVDFDGTIVEHTFPEIGAINNEMVEDMRHWWASDTNIIIVWTCRTGNYLNQARKFMLENNIPFDFINENPIVDMGGPKIFANEYHDDRAVRVKTNE